MITVARQILRRSVVPGALLTALLLTGCVSVPTSGPLRQVEGGQSGCQNCVNVEVAPPAPGNTPKEIVEGYLRATSNYQPNYKVARQFLTTAAAEKWTPDSGVTIYKGAPQVDGDSVLLTGKQIGFLEAGRFTARVQDLRLDFGMTRQGDQWRIGRPPAGLLVADFFFKQFYQPYALYFPGAEGVLVPDPIYLPNLGNPASIDSALVNALLGGPSRWLREVVATAVPTDTRLTADAVTVSADGVATVALSDTVEGLSEAQRSLLAAQLVYTLRQAVGVKGVLITVGQQPFRVPEGDPRTFVVAIDAISPSRDPLPVTSAEQLYAVRDGSVQTVGADADASSIAPMAGPLGKGRYDVDSLAVAVNGSELAAVTDGRTVLRRTATSTGEVLNEQIGVSRLLRPQFTRFGELWAIGDRYGRQFLWIYDGDQTAVIDLRNALGEGRITAFRVSPDGSRMAVIRSVADHQELGLARVKRADKVVVDGWRPLDTSGSNPRPLRLVDLAWLNATNLAVLGSSGTGATNLPFEVSQDAFSVDSTGGVLASKDADEVSVLLRTSTAFVVGRDGQTYRDNGGSWIGYLNKIDTLACPG